MPPGNPSLPQRVSVEQLILCPFVEIDLVIESVDSPAGAIVGIDYDDRFLGEGGRCCERARIE